MEEGKCPDCGEFRKIFMLEGKQLWELWQCQVCGTKWKQVYVKKYLYSNKIQERK